MPTHTPTKFVRSLSRPREVMMKAGAVIEQPMPLPQTRRNLFEAYSDNPMDKTAGHRIHPVWPEVSE